MTKKLSVWTGKVFCDKCLAPAENTDKAASLGWKVIPNPAEGQEEKNLVCFFCSQSDNEPLQIEVCLSSLDISQKNKYQGSM